MPDDRLHIVVLDLRLEDFRRACEFAADAMAILVDTMLRMEGREWDPETQHLLLSDEDREALDARAMGRTLEEIDAL